MAAKKKKPASKRKKTTKNNKKKPFVKWLFSTTLKLFMVFTALFICIFLWVDATVTTKFSGKKWELSSHVYARPLELYEGKSLRADDFAYELEQLGYKYTEQINQPGFVFRKGLQFHLKTRGFTFSDAVEPAKEIWITFSDERITELQVLDGQQLASASLVRLEPLMLGGIYPLHREDRLLVQEKDVPELLKKTLLLVEDRSFYQHSGLSLRGFARAMKANIQAGSVVQGGSTLTQQLVKNFYLDSRRTIPRKALEALMALSLELHYSKSEILEGYLNEVYLGQSGGRSIHGFGLGSQYYFRSPVNELSVEQIALLVALVKGPSYYNPWRYPVRAKQRRDLVLDIMRKEGLLTPPEALLAKEKPLLPTADNGTGKATYPAFLDLVKRQLRRDYKDDDLRTAGLSIFTSFDPIVQRQAEKSIKNGILKLESSYGIEPSTIEGSAIILTPDNSEISAVVGGRNPRFAGFNRALDAVRPIGSLVKPMVYAAAFAEGYTLMSSLNDKTITIQESSGKKWTPANYGRKEHGDVALHTALSHSYNLATVNLGMTLGLPKVVATIEQFEVKRNVPKVPALLLGALEMSPIEVAAMYQVIAADGFYAPVRGIRFVRDTQGNVLSRYPFKVKQVFSAETMYLLQYALQEVMREGTGKKAYRYLPNNLQSAGKTGTTNDQRDSWFAGFTGDHLAVVWLGQDNNEPTPLTGSSGALVIWSDLMANISHQSLSRMPPENIVFGRIDDNTRKRMPDNCNHGRLIPFVKKTEPRVSLGCDGKIIKNTWFNRLLY